MSLPPRYTGYRPTQRQPDKFVPPRISEQPPRPPRTPQRGRAWTINVLGLSITVVVRRHAEGRRPR